MRKLNQKGSVLIFLTLGFALLATFVGFALDFGRGYLEKARIARLIDAAALAAAKALKGQAGLQNQATRAACDSMQMNGANVTFTGGNTCTEQSGAPLKVLVEYFDVAVSGGPPMRHVRIRAEKPVPTTFLRFLGWLTPIGSTTNSCGVEPLKALCVKAQSEAGPERPIDLMLVLDRSGSMSGTKIAALKTTVNEFLDNNFSGDDRIGMVSFAWRGCGNAAGKDNFAANICQPDVPMANATSGNINTLKNRVNLLTPENGATNTMEALRTAHVPIAAAFNDATRVSTRKVVLLITDGKPTAMRRDTDAECRRNPKTGDPVAQWDTAPANSFPNGCIMEANHPNGAYATRGPLNFVPPYPTLSGWPQANLFQNTITCIRSLNDCNGTHTTDGVMYEANRIRNCGAGNADCNDAGEHDVLVFAIGIGSFVSSPANASFDKHAKCLLLRAANATELLNTGNNSIETMNTLCTPPPPAYADSDTYADLRSGWPCATGPCINGTQEKGKVYFVNQTGNVQAQMQQVFAEIAAILKLRLTL